MERKKKKTATGPASAPNAAPFEGEEPLAEAGGAEELKGGALSLQTQLVLLFLVVFLVLGGVVGAAIYGFEQARQQTNEVNKRYLRSITLLEQVRTSVNQAHINLMTTAKYISQTKGKAGADGKKNADLIQSRIAKVESQIENADRLWKAYNNSALKDANEKPSQMGEYLNRYRQGARQYFQILMNQRVENADHPEIDELASPSAQTLVFSDDEKKYPLSRVLSPALGRMNQELGETIDEKIRLANSLSAKNPNETRQWWLVAAGAAGVVVLLLMALFLRRQIVQAIQHINQNVRALSRGNLKIKKLPPMTPEFAELAGGVNRLNANLSRIASFAKEIGQGEFDSDFKPMSDKDQLGIALQEMRNQLHEVAEEDQRRNWAVAGLAQFSEILRLSDDVEELAEQVISMLAKYINGNQGAFFMLNDDDPTDVKLEMIGSYAYVKRKFSKREFRLNEGFVGQAAAEKDTIYISDIPVDYLTMTSGLGEATPKCLLIVPLVHNDTVHGVVEFASFANFADYQVEFVKKISENIGATLGSLKSKAKTLRLLEESQKLSAELQQKQGELEEKARVMGETQVKMLATQQELNGQLSALNHAAIVSETNLEGVITFVNDQFCDVSHYNREELLGQKHNILKTNTYPDARFFDNLWATLLAGKVWKGEFKNRNRHGAYYWVEAAITPVADANGKLFKFISVQFDITNQKNQEEQIRHALEESLAQEEELRQNTEELEASQEEMRRTQIELTGQINALNNSAIVSEADLQGRIISVNEQFIRISRYTREELIGQNHRVLKSGHQDDGLFESLWQTITAGKVWKGEFKNKSKGGMHYWVTATITPVLDGRGRPMKYISVTFDVTAQKLQEEQIRAALEISQAQESELRQNAEELQLAQDEMRKTQIELRGQIGALNHAGIVAETDLRGNITMVNEEFTRIARSTREDLLGQNHRILKSGQLTEEFYHGLWESITNGKVWSGVFKNRARDGSFYWVKSTITPVLGFDGKPVKYIGVSFDITPQILQEEAIQKALEISQMQEIEIRQKQQQMDAIFSNIPGVIYRRLPDEAWTMELISEHAKGLTGYPAHEFLHNRERSFVELILPEDLEKVKAAVQVALENCEPFNLVYRILDADGHVKWAREEGRGVYNENAELLYVDGAIFDITLQKELEDHLVATLNQTRLQEEQLRANAEIMQTQQIELAGQIGALNNAGIVLETNLAGEITFINEEAVHSWGYERDEILGQNPRLLKSGEHKEEFYQELWAAITAGQVWKGDVNNRTKDGGDVWSQLTITPVLDAEGKPLKYIALYFDITRMRRQASRIKALFEESKRQEEELRNNAKFMEEVQEEMAKTTLELTGQVNAINNAAMVSESDLDGNIIYANDEAVITWRYSTQELMGQNHRILKSGKHKESFYSRMWEKITSGFVWQGQVQNKAKDGSEFWVALTITPVLDKDGNPYKYIGVAFDITHQKNQSARIKESLDLAEAQEKDFRRQIQELSAQLQDLQQKEAAVTENRPADMVWVKLNPKGVVLEGSNLFFEIFKAKLPETGLSLTKLMDHIAQPMFLGELKQKQTFNWTVEYAVKGERKRWFHCHISYLPETEEYEAFLFEITTQKETEQALRKAMADSTAPVETRIEKVVEIKEVADTKLLQRWEAVEKMVSFLECSPDFELTNVNAALCKELDYESEKLVGKPLVELLSADGQKGFAAMETALSEAGDWAGVLPFLKPDGSVLELETVVFAVRDDKMNLKGFTAIASARNHEAMNAPVLKDADADNRSIALNQTVVVSETDILGAITFVNEAFVQLSGYTAEELLGQNHRILKSPDLYKGTYFDLWATISRGKTWQGDMENLNHLGEKYWLDLRIMPILNEAGKPQKYLAIGYNITPWRKQLDKLKAQAEALKLKAATPPPAANEAQLLLQQAQLAEQRAELDELRRLVEELQNQPAPAPMEPAFAQPLPESPLPLPETAETAGHFAAPDDDFNPQNLPLANFEI